LLVEPFPILRRQGLSDVRIGNIIVSRLPKARTDFDVLCK